MPDTVPLVSSMSRNDSAGSDFCFRRSLQGSLSSLDCIARMADNLFDSVMQRVGGKEWNYDSLAVPQRGLVKAEEIEEPISLRQFLAEACRRTDGGKVTTMIFDVHTGVPEFGGFARVGEQIQRGELDGLPPPLQVSRALPKGAKMGAIIENLHDGTLNVVKIMHFPDCVPSRPMGSAEDRAVSSATSPRLSGFVE